MISCSIFQHVLLPQFNPQIIKIVQVIDYGVVLICNVIGLVYFIQLLNSLILHLGIHLGKLLWITH